jgi:hypothetical protein
MNTLTTIHSLVWDIANYGGKAAFLFPALDMSVTFHPSVGEYTLWCGKQELLSDKCPSMCLEVADEAILDHYASQFVPSWEEEDVAPTERMPQVWDNAAE